MSTPINIVVSEGAATVCLPAVSNNGHTQVILSSDTQEQTPTYSYFKSMTSSEDVGDLCSSNFHSQQVLEAVPRAGATISIISGNRKHNATATSLGILNSCDYSLANHLAKKSAVQMQCDESVRSSKSVHTSVRAVSTSPRQDSIMAASEVQPHMEGEPSSSFSQSVPMVTQHSMYHIC